MKNRYFFFEQLLYNIDKIKKIKNRIRFNIINILNNIYLSVTTKQRLYKTSSYSYVYLCVLFIFKCFYSYLV